MAIEQAEKRRQLRQDAVGPPSRVGIGDLSIEKLVLKAFGTVREYHQVKIDFILTAWLVCEYFTVTSTLAGFRLSIHLGGAHDTPLAVEAFVLPSLRCLV
jgi:hypothetical protein